MKKLRRVVLGVSLFILLFIVGYFVVVLYLLNGVFEEPVYSKEDLIKNYELYESEIAEVKEFVKNNVSENIFIDIEFKGENVSIFHTRVNGLYEPHWGDLNKADLNNILLKLDWTLEDFNLLKEQLSKAHCISVSNSGPIKIGWQRSGMGMYFYQFFDNNLSDSLILDYNSSCTQIFYKNNIGLLYGGGVFGPQCFPNKEL